MFSIIIPAYNEEEAIGNTIMRCAAIVKEIGNDQTEIIVNLGKKFLPHDFFILD